MTHMTEQFASFDGTRLAVHTIGEGRPVVLLHGLFSSAQMNWIKWGHGERLAAAGMRAIMLDFRVHGQSEAPRDPQAYPPGVLVRDVAALAEHLALEPGGFDLVGFSLGARTAIHTVAHGILEPRRLCVCGMGVEGLAGWERRANHFKRVIDEFDTIKPGDPAYTARTFLKSQGVDRVAARLLLDAMDDFDLAMLANITMPTAAWLSPNGNHMAEPTSLSISSRATKPCPWRITRSQSSGRWGQTTETESSCSCGTSDRPMGTARSS